MEFVSTCTTVTVAPMMVAPELSVTVPVIEPVMPCPKEEGAIEARSRRQRVRTGLRMAALNMCREAGIRVRGCGVCGAKLGFSVDGVEQASWINPISS